jgi:hypothetical protein
MGEGKKDAFVQILEKKALEKEIPDHSRRLA